jgi:hypothetical protein
MKRSIVGSLLALACLLHVSPARAHGTAGVMALASTASHGGALALEYEFDAVSRLSFSTSILGTSIYTGIIPAFEPIAADDVPNSLYVVDGGTVVTVAITAIDQDKVKMKIDTTTMSAVGDTAVLGTMPFGHTHPQFSLELALPEGEFGEGRVSFKLISTGPTIYAESEIYTVKLSNGPLPVPDYDTAAYDSASVKCLATSSREARKFTGKVQTFLSKCLDTVQVYSAKAALASPPSNLAALLSAAEKACADAAGAGPDSSTLLGRIQAAKARAVAKIEADCGATGSTDFVADDVTQFLGLTQCRAEELLAASYGVAKDQLEELNFTLRASQGGGPLIDSFPCIVVTATD